VRRLVLAAVMTALLAGCGSAAETAQNPEPPDSSPPVRVQHVKVGAAVLLTGADSSGGTGTLRLGVKVQQVLSSATGQGAFEIPRKGERFVAARFVLKNLGAITYDDSPTYGAKVVDQSGREYDPTVATVSAGRGFGRLLRLSQDQAASGFIVFAVPRAAKITGVRYTLNAGDRGEWDVPNGISRARSEQRLHADRARGDGGNR
jgi:opacity protein-like surface antigen